MNTLLNTHHHQLLNTHINYIDNFIEYSFTKPTFIKH